MRVDKHTQTSNSKWNIRTCGSAREYAALISLAASERLEERVHLHSLTKDLLFFSCTREHGRFKKIVWGSLFFLSGLRRDKTCLRGFANNTGADQPAHPRSLISAFCYSFLGKYHNQTFYKQNFNFLASLCS